MDAAKRVKPGSRNLLGTGRGAGNCTLKMLSKTPNLNCTLLGLSQPMLGRASDRTQEVASGEIKALQGDIREITRPTIIMVSYLLVLCCTASEAIRIGILHLSRIYDSLKPGGSFRVSDLVARNSAEKKFLFKDRCGNYL